MDSLRDIFEEFISWRKSYNMPETTEKSVRSQTAKFFRFIEDNFDIRTPHELQRAHLMAYQKYLAGLTNLKGMPLQPGSVNNLIGAARTFLKYMVDNGYIATKLKKTLRTVKVPDLLPTSVLTHNQVKQIIKSIDCSNMEGIRNRVIVELLYSSGIRVGELVKLKLRDVDIKNGIMKVFGKGSKERIVPIGKTALRYLESYVKGARPFLNKKRSDWMFLNSLGNPITIPRLETIIPKLAEQAGIKDIRVTPHTFRRSCATEMIRGNANIYHVKELLGHESLSTLKHYSKLTIVDLKKTHARCHPREKD